jgi:hypothetical protein
MATHYVDSTAAGAGTGADWANAFTTLAAAFTAGAAGDTFYVAHDHAETQASAMTITTKGSASAPCRVICVNSAGTVPPVSADLAATATITTTGANALTINGGSVCYFEGIQFNAGSGATTAALTVQANDQRLYFKNCQFKKNGTTASGSAMVIGNGRSNIFLDNCTFSFGANSDSIYLAGQVYWRNSTAFAGVAASTSGALTTNSDGNYSDLLVEGVDLSALTSGNLIRGTFSWNSTWTFKDCKLHATPSVTTTFTSPHQGIDFIRCNSGDVNYSSSRYRYQGVLTTETTTVRTGGASDGTTTIAWKIVPTASNERDFPFECFPITVWNETVGEAITITVEGIWAGGAVPTTADIWMDVEYLGTSGYPLGNFAAGLADSLTTGAAHTTSSETWGAGGTTKFKMFKSITPQEVGPITVYVKYANVTNNVWIDPLLTVS